MQAFPIRTRCNAFNFFKEAYKVVYVAKAAVGAHLPNAVLVFGKQLLRKLNTLVIYVVKRGNAKLLFKPGKKGITAKVCFAAQVVHQYFTGKVFMYIMQYILQPSFVAVSSGLQAYLFKVLALHKPYQ